MRNPGIPLVIAVLVACCTPARAASPWEFSTDEERRAVEQREGSWVRAYRSATDALDEAGPYDHEAVVQQLKLAISEEPESQKGGLVFAKVRRVYFPYFYLGLAYARAGAWRLSGSCLAKEDAEKILDVSRLAPLFTSLRDDVQGMLDLGGTRGCAERAVACSKGEGAMVLVSGRSAERTREISSILTMNEGLGHAPGSGKLGKAVNTFRDRIETQLGPLYQDELGARRVLLQSLSAESWRQIGFKPPAQEITDACQDVEGRCEVREQKVLKCAARTVDALRPALERACGMTTSARKAAEAAAAGARGWAEAIGARPPTLPKLPEIDALCVRFRSSGVGVITTTPVSEISALPSAVIRAEQAKVKMLAARDVQRDEARARAGSILRGLALPKRNCALALGLGSRFDQVARLRRVLARGPEQAAPPEEFAEAIRDVGDHWLSLRESALSGAQGILESPEGDAPQDALDRLRAGVDAYAGSSRGADDLQRLCDLVAPVVGATKFAEEAAEVRREGLQAALLFAQTWQSGGASGVAGCAEELVPKLGENADEALWVEAESCFAEAEADAAEFTIRMETVSRELDSLPELLRSFEALFAQSLDSAGSVTADAAIGSERARELIEFVADGPESIAEIERGASDLKLGRAPRNWVKAIEALERVPDDLSIRATRLGRTILVRSSAAELAQRLSVDHGDRIASGRAALLVRGAFERVDSGDLDAAIRELREGARGLALWNGRKGPALVDATLAYLLRLRARAEEPGSASHAALTEESTLLLARAARSAPSLDLPTEIFSEEFRNAWGRALEGGR